MDEIQLQPLGARVLIQPDRQDQVQTNRGIYVPDTSKDKPRWGEVIAIGDQEQEIRVKVGNQVLYTPNTGTEININNTRYLIIEAKHLLAVIKG